MNQQAISGEKVQMGGLVKLHNRIKGNGTKESITWKNSKEITGSERTKSHISNHFRNYWILTHQH